MSTLTWDNLASGALLKRTTLLDLCVSSLRRRHANLLSIVPREIHELCVSSLRQGRAIFTVLQGLTPSWSRNFRNAQRPSSCCIDQKNQYLHSRIMRVILAQGHAPCFKFSMCHHASKKRKPNIHQRLLKYVPSVFKSIPFVVLVSDEEIRTSRVPSEQMIESSIGPISEPSSVQSTQHVFARCVPQ